MKPSPILIGGMDPRRCRLIDASFIANGVSREVNGGMSVGTYLFRDLFESVDPEVLFGSMHCKSMIHDALNDLFEMTTTESRSPLSKIISFRKWRRLRMEWSKKGFTHKSKLFEVEEFLSFLYRSLIKNFKAPTPMRLTVSSPTTLLYLKYVLSAFPDVKYVHILSNPINILKIPYHDVMVKWSKYLSVQLRNEISMYAYQDSIDVWNAYHQLLMKFSDELMRRNVMIVDESNFEQNPEHNLNRIMEFLEIDQRINIFKEIDSYNCSDVRMNGFDEKYFNRLLDENIEYQSLMEKMTRHADCK